MPRYRHWLYQVRPAPWPGAVITLTTEVDYATAESASESDSPNLRRWHLAVATRHAGGYAVGRVASGADGRGFWGAVASAVVRTRNLWIISGCFRRDAAALGLWGLLESGAVRVDGCDPSDSGPTRRRRRGQTGGLMVLQDPPVICRLKLASGGPALTWVDAANYGIGSDTGPAGTPTTALELAEWFGRAASTLSSISDCGWCSTAASQAMHLYRRTYLATPILAHTHPGATALESDGLFGGRCEVFRLGNCAGACHLYDFKAHYPAVCSSLRVPTQLRQWWKDPSLASVCDAMVSDYVIAKVDIETDVGDYPYAYKQGVIYPVGRFTTTIGGAELADAMQNGRARRVRRAAVYVADSCLSRFMCDLQACRKTAEAGGDGAITAWIKRLSNSLPGKFAQQERKWVSCPGAEAPEPWGEWYAWLTKGVIARWRSLGGTVQREVQEGWAHGSIPAIAGAVTCSGRARLLQALRAAGRNHVLYCDTDAVIVDDAGRAGLSRAGLCRAGEWGYLQHVVSADGCEIYGVKHYRIADRIRAAGETRHGARRTGGDADATRTLTAGESIRAHERPTGRLIPYRYTRGPGRYDGPREPGGWVKPVELDEWEK